MSGAIRAVFWLRLALAIALASLAVPGRSETTEAELKAAFIYNFSKYVDWPASAVDAAPGGLTLCLLGPRDTLFDALAELQGKVVKERPLIVRAVGRNADFKTCHVLVFSESEAEYFEALLRNLAGLPVLTVNGSGRFLDSGGTIGLALEGGKVRFDINLIAARRNNLVLSSNLLKLARHVRQ